MKKIFIYTDIILDLLAKRDPHYIFSAELFSLIDSGKIQACVSPLIIANLHYILSRLQGKKKVLTEYY